MDNEEEIDVDYAPTFTEAEDALLNDPDPTGALLDRLRPAVGTPLLDTLALQTVLTVWAAGDHLEACTVGGPEGRWADAAHRVVTEVLNGLGRRAGRPVPDAGRTYTCAVNGHRLRARVVRDQLGLDIRVHPA